MIVLKVNGTKLQTDVGTDTPLLWVLREKLGLTGTKFGCGEGLCGACTVQIDGAPQRSCITPVGDVQGKKIITIEGIPENHPVKKAWLAEEVSQCGYCQPGQIMSAVALLAEEAETDRCGYRQRHERQPLPLRHLWPHPSGDPCRQRQETVKGRENTMSKAPENEPATVHQDQRPGRRRAAAGLPSSVRRRDAAAAGKMPSPPMPFCASGGMTA